MFRPSDDKIVHLASEIMEALVIYDPQVIIQKYEQIVLNTRDPYLSSMFASEVLGANIQEHSQIVIDSKRLDCNYYFARRIKGVDVQVHESIILESEDPASLEWSCKFATFVDGANVEAHENRIYSSNDKELIAWYEEMKAETEKHKKLGLPHF